MKLLCVLESKHKDYEQSKTLTLKNCMNNLITEGKNHLKVSVCVCIAENVQMFVKRLSEKLALRSRFHTWLSLIL